MGCWNHTCFLSNLSIGCGEEMALMTLIRTSLEMGAYAAVEHYYPAPVMIYGKYDDYGGMENCHGSEINYLLSEFVDNHTLEDTVDIEEFTRLGDQGSLYFSDINTFHDKLKGNKNAGIPVQHVVIKLRVLERFLEQYYFTDYHILKDPEQEINKDNYVPINYEYLCNSIPAYIEKLKTYYAENSRLAVNTKKVGQSVSLFSNLIFNPVPEINRDNPNIMGQWLHFFAKDVGVDFFKKSYTDRIQALAEANKDEELTSCLQEFCKYIMIYSYMNFSRRVYIRPQCSSQETDPIAHKLMAEITLAEIEQQRIDWEKEDFPNDAWDPKREVYMEQCEMQF